MVEVVEVVVGLRVGALPEMLISLHPMNPETLETKFLIISIIILMPDTPPGVIKLLSPEEEITTEIRILLNFQTERPSHTLGSNGMNGSRGSGKRNQRLGGFGARLTDANLIDSAIAQGPSAAVVASTNIDLSELSLAARLAVELSTNAYDCLICISTVKWHQPTYSCPNCFTIYHLSCTSKWASRSVVDTSTKARLLADRDGIPCSEEASRGDWRCPGCQNKHIGKESVPQKYLCWCGKVENPRRNHEKSDSVNQASKVPHGCGLKCGKITTEGCTHGCEEECHPGSCPPCASVIKTFCHCKKSQKTIRCSQLYKNRNSTNDPRIDLLSCEEICGQKLGCGLHFCQRSCHPGECGRCEVVREKSCYCGQVNLNQQRCSDSTPDHKLSHKTEPEKLISFLPDGAELIGEFFCKSECPWKYDCNIHKCESKCHPHSAPTPLPCPLSPAVLKTCPCGSMLLSPRSSCTDPIATCKGVCRKSIGTCGHSCQKTCHSGPCGPCKASVTTVCVCGRDQISRRCIELDKLKEEALLENSLLPASERKNSETVIATAIEHRCERVCRVLRHCGKHTCNRRCCPLSFLENVLQTGKSKKSQTMRQHEEEDPLGFHLCHLICNKKLSCALHTCQLRDHKGPCPPCLQASFDNLVCHCGSTVIHPPVPCGTKVNCSQPCIRPAPDCGHPKAPHTCHIEEQCPPCPYLAAKSCQCDKKTLVRNVRCSQPKVSCGLSCGNLLGCGAHRCAKKCHLPGECEICEHECLKPRKFCMHPCKLRCHAPTACSTGEPCDTLIDAKCECGHITQRVKCACCDSRPEGNLNRVINCNDDCMLFQRNSALAKALGISNSSKENSEDETSWSNGAIQFFGSNVLFCKSVERQLEDFLKLSSKSSFVLPTHSEIKRAFVFEMANKYCLNVEAVGDEPRFGVRLVRKPESLVPKTVLSKAHEDKLPSNSTKAPYSNKKIMNSILLEGVSLQEESSLKKLLDPVIDGQSFTINFVGMDDALLTIERSPNGFEDENLQEAAFSASEELIQQELKLIYANLNKFLEHETFCKKIYLTRQDSNGSIGCRKVMNSAGGWKVAGSTTVAEDFQKNPTLWQLKSSGVTFTNSFEALSLSGRVKSTLSKKSKKLNDSGDPWDSGGIVGGGYNRPPSAVIAPVASSSRAVLRKLKEDEEEVIDDWEQTVADK
ncbi:hypothetical protein PPACK8108_LOCUS60 [Phakopsora pachyrhizi]|uniref:R3H domain-containing protein n=1 Tax=Phakopsora pachyrhizi TaxID=170000 RepID=A0AAV0ACR4_PHAPC|nr:hypothetical protein PPACK8108_LOCUS60 [Phakopsora pachyrhizi]